MNRVIFANKSFRVEWANIKMDHCGNYKRSYFVDWHNGKNVTSFSTADEAIAYANRRAYT